MTTAKRSRNSKEENYAAEAKTKVVPRQKKPLRVEYFPGQLVYRRQMVRGRKFDLKWLGTYQVEGKISDLVYQVRVW